MSRACEDKFALRHEVVRYAKTHGLHAAVRQFGGARNTVRLWFRRWEAGDDTLADHSRRPHHQPRRTKAAHEKPVIAARKKAPCFGARRLVDRFELPVGKGAVHRILRDEKLIRPRPRKHRRKADLRAIKAAHPPLCRLPMDTKYLTDIPHYWPQIQAQGLPRFQSPIRCEATGALFLAYASDLSKTCATLAQARVLAHCKAHGIALKNVEVRTDLGSEFDGDTVPYRPDGFHRSITATGATHRFNPPAPTPMPTSKAATRPSNLSSSTSRTLPVRPTSSPPSPPTNTSSTSPAKTVPAAIALPPRFSPLALPTSTLAPFYSRPPFSTLPWVNICLDLPQSGIGPCRGASQFLES